MHDYVIHYVMQDRRGCEPWLQNVVAREVAANEDAAVKVADVAVQVAAVDREVAAKVATSYFFSSYCIIVILFKFTNILYIMSCRIQEDVILSPKKWFQKRLLLQMKMPQLRWQML